MKSNKKNSLGCYRPAIKCTLPSTGFFSPAKCRVYFIAFLCAIYNFGLKRLQGINALIQTRECSAIQQNIGRTNITGTSFMSSLSRNLKNEFSRIFRTKSQPSSIKAITTTHLHAFSRNFNLIPQTSNILAQEKQPFK